jgi:hypothetical protein
MTPSSCGDRVLRLGTVNPRHRRLVIPVALAVLLIIVIVAAVWP